MVWDHWILPRSRQLGSRVLISVPHIHIAAEDTHFLVALVPLNPNTVPSQEPPPTLCSCPQGPVQGPSHDQGQRWAQPSFGGKDTGMGWGGEEESTQPGPLPRPDMVTREEGPRLKRKGTTGGWYPPACQGWAPQKDVLSCCPVPEPLHLPSSHFKKEGVVGPLSLDGWHPASWLSGSLLLMGADTCPALSLGQGLGRELCQSSLLIKRPVVSLISSWDGVQMCTRNQ